MRPKRSFIIDLRPEKPLAALVSNLEAPLVIEKLEVLAGASALKDLCHNYNAKNRYTHAIVGCYPESRFLKHAILENPSKAREESFFTEFLKSQYQLNIDENSVTVLNPATGLPVDFEKVVPKELVIAGGLQKEFQQIQGDLVAQGIYPERLEMGTLATLGGVMSYQHAQQMGSSSVVLQWGKTQSIFSICSAKRVELVRSTPWGTDALISQIKTSLGLKDEASALKILSTGGFDLKEMGPAFLKGLIKELQASAGFFEVQTGQALKHFIIELLPENLGWVEAVLAQYLGLDLLSIDYEGWLNTLGIKTSDELPISTLTREHFGIISLMINNFEETNERKK